MGNMRMADSEWHDKTARPNEENDKTDETARNHRARGHVTETLRHESPHERETEGGVPCAARGTPSPCKCG